MSIKPILEKIEKYRTDKEAKRNAERQALEDDAVARMKPILDLIPDIAEFASYTQQPCVKSDHSVEWELAFGGGQKALLRTNGAAAWSVIVFTPAGTPRTESYAHPENAVKYLICALTAKTYDEIDELYLKAFIEPEPKMAMTVDAVPESPPSDETDFTERQYGPDPG